MATNGGAVQPAAANGDTGMEDEIMVKSTPWLLTRNLLLTTRK
jgi:hypothetical protein